MSAGRRSGSRRPASRYAKLNRQAANPAAATACAVRTSDGECMSDPAPCARITAGAPAQRCPLGRSYVRLTRPAGVSMLERRTPLYQLWRDGAADAADSTRGDLSDTDGPD